MKIKVPPFFGYFGSALDDLKINGEYSEIHFLILKSKLSVAAKTKISSLVFLEQVHGNRVITIDKNTAISAILDIQHHQGDAIITNLPHIAIGVATADCLPLLVFDPIKKAIGVIHAGWKGLRARVITATINQMKQAFNSDPKNLMVWIGPAAKSCCYEIKQDFINEFEDAKNYLEWRNDKLFFLNGKMATTELNELGIANNQIDTRAYHCTICTPSFCSFRKDKEKSGRQPSVALLL